VPNWRWIAKQVRRAGRPIKVLNLFAYTGGSTLAAARAGAQVVHVDAAKNVVSWARRNARLSGLSEAPIRWITEDARKFVSRELKRENLYDAVVLDPPSYGHGPKGEAFQLDDDLMPLLADCGALTAGHRTFMLMTCHSPAYGPAELEACLADAVLGSCSAGALATTLDLQTGDGRRLNAGVSVRWPG
jgi:23S rRNA (cytosine1962-C5)-methyltransferase